MSELASVESTSWVRQLEGPQEVAGLLEVRSNSENLVNQILHTDDAVLAKVVFDQLVVGEGNSLLVDLSVTSLVNELSYGLEVGVAKGNVWVDNGQHLLSSSSQSNEDTIVDLDKSEKLEDLSWLGCNLVDTLDSDNEDELVLFFNVE